MATADGLEHASPAEARQSFLIENKMENLYAGIVVGLVVFMIGFGFGRIE